MPQGLFLKKKEGVVSPSGNRVFVLENTVFGGSGMEKIKK